MSHTDRGAISRGENLSGNDKRCGVGAEIEEEEADAVEEDKERQCFLKNLVVTSCI